MAGRCQRALHQVLQLAQQQQQQCCQQLEVLGYQVFRHKSGRPSKQQVPKIIREQFRRESAARKALQHTNATTAASASPSTSSSEVAATAAPVGSSSDTTTSNSSNPTTTTSSSSGGPVRSPLSAAFPENAPTAPASSSTSAQLAATQDSKPKSSWAPAWLNRLIDGPTMRRQPQPPPGTPSPLQKDTPAPGSKGHEQQQDDGGWEELIRLKDMTLDDYYSAIKSDPAAGQVDSPPQPKTPRRGPTANKGSWADEARILYAKYEQQSSVISSLDTADKERIKQDPDAVVKDEAYIKHLASTRNVTPTLVIDLIRSFQRRRKEMSLLADYREAGNTLPNANDDDALRELLSKLMQQAQRDKMKGLLALRTPDKCQLRPWAHMRSVKHRTCPQTQLPFKDCCGALKGKNYSIY